MYEVVFAIAGLIAVAYLVLQRKVKQSTKVVSLLLTVVLLASILIPASAAGSAVVVSSKAIPAIVVSVIMGIVIIANVTMWIAMRLKKGRPFPRNSVIEAIILTAVLTNVRYTFTGESEDKPTEFQCTPYLRKI